MKIGREQLLLYAVTDRKWVGKQSLMEQVKDALKNGVSCVQLREKELSEREYLEEAVKMKQLCREYQVPFIINDSVDIALACGADGVHLGQNDRDVAEVRRLVGSDMIIGATAHNVEEAMEAVKNGADYLGLGAVFGSTTKTDAKNMSGEMLREICQAVELPVVAIGGISNENILQLKGSGVDGVAVVSAIFGADDISVATRELYEKACEILR